ncbi:hypothetical protein HBI56_229390 [Parastagonospora nodorum]|uniref:C2H2-type domain-containing protein n=1 Tax=Phaeosphaeria nodorum (strain SN15 / ATCC MYA-4574 / FGSC 10173) TaxID=321614 RepID=A0A7U2F9G8_PHANO|nr:hypothetical protein HBH56_201730 [Parastagonospora nodorum]QRD00883.1 hypothetical protein JI435_094100 [Parastagonospora nodorum SN15]KAH3925895.1 hypothetical protein HBH54_174560 [Parastagonospora nodorum]KAH3952997.1 hypothetical protein HBH53_035930 [Parastagonospora nodorum]KAH3984540.1 hypothetical protein HBH51_026070 [Parastagonospora nodorum]
MAHVSRTTVTLSTSPSGNAVIRDGSKACPYRPPVFDVARDFSSEKPTLGYAVEYCNIETTASDLRDAQQSWSDCSGYNPDLSLEEGNLSFDGLGEDYTDGLLMGSGQSKDRLVFPRPVQNPISVGVQTSPTDVLNPSMGPELEYWSNDHESALSYVGPRSDAKLSGFDEGSPPSRIAHGQHGHSVRPDAEDVIVCPDCMATFTGTHVRGNYNRHRRMRHAEGQHEQYTCMENQCGRMFSRQDALEKHLRNRHGLNTSLFPRTSRRIE